jgi:4-carboxymuconolactone decarboxylase
MEEFTLHARCALRAGLSDSELDELIVQIGAYCGAPAAISARRALRAARELREAE